MKNFSKKQIAFIQNKAENYGNADSVIRSGYRVRVVEGEPDRNQASKYAWELLQKQEILEAIQRKRQEIFDSNGITDDVILTSSWKIFEKTTSEDLKLKVLSFLADCKGMKTHNVKQENTNINKEDSLALNRLFDNPLSIN